MRFILITVSLLCSMMPLAHADNSKLWGKMRAPSNNNHPILVAENLLPKKAIRGTKMPSATVRLGNKQAADRVKQKYRKHKILSINLIRSRGPGTYRIKTLSEDGVVKYVFVDGNTGEVFE